MQVMVRNVLRIAMETLVLAVGLVVGAIGGLWFRGPAMGLDETILFTYVAPGSAAGVFAAAIAVQIGIRWLKDRLWGSK